MGLLILSQEVYCNKPKTALLVGIGKYGIGNFYFPFGFLDWGGDFENE